MNTYNKALTSLPALALFVIASTAVAAPVAPPDDPRPAAARPRDPARPATARPGAEGARGVPRSAAASVAPAPARVGCDTKKLCDAKKLCDTKKLCDAKKLCDTKKLCDPAKVCDPKKLKHPDIVCFKRSKKKKKKLSDGWHPKLSLGASMSMIHTQNVPGVDDGLSLTLGAVVNASLLYKRKQHRWLSKLSLVHGWSKTPAIAPMVKSADELSLKTEYQYHFKRARSLSLVAGLHFAAPVAPGDLVLPEDTTLMLNNIDGTQVSDALLKNKRYRLTDAFAPLVFKQLAGLNIRPYKTLLTALDVRLSLAGQQVWASGYAVNDDEETPELDLVELENFQQVGIQLEANLVGRLHKRLVYAFRVELMFPMYTSVDTELAGFDLLNTDISFKVGVKMSKWASINYVFAAKRIPVLVDQWQIINNLVLSISANIL